MNSYMQNNQYYGRPTMYNQPMYNQPMYGQPAQNQQPIQQPISQIVSQQIGIQGKSVDSIEVVKAMDIPLDGSISYFPLTDGTAIVTKQLMQDGTSKTIIYKPIENEKIESTVKYITEDEFTKSLKKLDLSDDIKTLKRQIKSLMEEFEELKDRKE